MKSELCWKIWGVGLSRLRLPAEALQPFPSSSAPNTFLLSSLSAPTFSPLPLGSGSTSVPRFSPFHIKLYQCLPPTLFFPLFQGKIHPYPFPGLVPTGLQMPLPPCRGVPYLPAPPSPFTPSASPLPLTLIVFISSGCCHKTTEPGWFKQ